MWLLFHPPPRIRNGTQAAADSPGIAALHGGVCHDMCHSVPTIPDSELWATSQQAAELLAKNVLHFRTKACDHDSRISIFEARIEGLPDTQRASPRGCACA